MVNGYWLANIPRAPMQTRARARNSRDREYREMRAMHARRVCVCARMCWSFSSLAS